MLVQVLTIVNATELVYKQKGELPEKLMTQYPNITSLVATNLGIQKLSKTFGKPPILMSNLDLSQNLISEIEALEFFGLQQLTTLSLANNLLEVMEKSVFTGLNNVRCLILSHNHLRQLNIEVFSPLSNVTELYLDNNQLTSINFNLFKKTPKLRKLDLQSNQMVEIQQSYDILVRELNLSNNNLQDLIFLGHCKRLESLDLSFNVNAKLPDSSFTYNKNLTTLIMRNISLTPADIDKLLNSSTNLEHLDVGYNYWKSIKFRQMPNLKNLRSMNLTGNELTEFDITNLNQHSPKLSTIDITGHQMNGSALTTLMRYFNDHKINLVEPKVGYTDPLIVAGIAIALMVVCPVAMAVWLDHVYWIRRYQKGVDLNSDDLSSTGDDSDDDLPDDFETKSMGSQCQLSIGSAAAGYIDI
jgi:Leucine-rich repeat (LRR) protein